MRGEMKKAGSQREEPCAADELMGSTKPKNKIRIILNCELCKATVEDKHMK